MDLRHYDNVAHGLNESYEDVQEGLSTPYGIARTSVLMLSPQAAYPGKPQLSALASVFFFQKINLYSRIPAKTTCFRHLEFTGQKYAHAKRSRESARCVYRLLSTSHRTTQMVWFLELWRRDAYIRPRTPRMAL